MTDLLTLPVAIYPDLAGKVAVVTGGSKGIGAATCRLLAVNGAKVAVVARDKSGIDPLVGELSAGGADAIGVSANLVNSADVKTMRDEVEERLGVVDILVAFAGGFGHHTPIWEIEEEEWQFVIESNLTSTFLTCKAFLPGMIERRRGAIVTMASNGGRFLDIPLTASYAAAKAGIVMFTRHVAREVGAFGVRANCVAPATVLSERIKRILTPERIAEIAAMSPLGRIGLPEDVAAATVFLVSDSSSWLTGVTIDVAGGRIML